MAGNYQPSLSPVLQEQKLLENDWMFDDLFAHDLCSEDIVALGRIRAKLQTNQVKRSGVEG